MDLYLYLDLDLVLLLVIVTKIYFIYLNQRRNKQLKQEEHNLLKRTLHKSWNISNSIHITSIHLYDHI